jgi:hypothetical protein
LAAFAASEESLGTMKKLFHAGSLCAIFIGMLAPARSGSAGIDPAVSLRGQLSGNARIIHDAGESTGDGALRYLPQLTLAFLPGPGRLADVEISANAFGSADSDGEADSDLALYRLKFRFATARTESRLGLQQLNFGPAYLLRPLRWFDVLDPRDPLMLTDGVRAFSFRYTSPSNASLWLWGLYSNDELKGYETAPTADKKGEFGGRAQIPVPGGEIACSYHRRIVDGTAPFMEDYAEQRFALDGKWDVEIGLWFEAVLTESASAALPYDWGTMAVIGADYTLPIGNGIHVLAEQMAIALSGEPFGWEDDAWFSGLSLAYPAGYIDRFSAIAFYSWDDNEYSLYGAWQRTWDALALNVSAFRFPRSMAFGGARDAAFARAGTGGQITIIINH